MKAQPYPRARQVWRNKKSGRLVRIDHFEEYPKLVWAVLNGQGRGPSSGVAVEYNWNVRYEFVADSEDDL